MPARRRVAEILNARLYVLGYGAAGLGTDVVPCEQHEEGGESSERRDSLSILHLRTSIAEQEGGGE
jgi:hypothetical protein